jgi:O-succinylbenzoic acid--CoA ligase
VDDPARDHPPRDRPAGGDPGRDHPPRDRPPGGDPAGGDPARDRPAGDDPAGDDPAPDHRALDHRARDAEPAVPLVALALPPAATVAALDACWEAGAAVLPLDPAAPPAERARALDAFRPTELWDAAGRRPLADGEPAPAGTAVVVATSGTTGEPRGVELSHSALHAAAAAVDTVVRAGPADRWLCCLPLHHVAGLAVVVRARWAGRPVEVHDGFDPERVAAALLAGATLLSLVPTMLGRLLDAGAPVERARLVLLGGGPIPPALRRRAERAGATVRATYGLSETGGGVVYDGWALPGVDVRTDGPEGEILLRGPMLFQGYRLRPELTAAAFVDGWLRTGDAGRLAPDGRLEVVDRIKDLVVTGGVNVSPTEVERVLAGCPGVRDVAVGRRPDPEWGERVVAYVVPADPGAPPDLPGLRAHAARHLAAAKLPRELVVVDTLPRSPGGKVLRRLLG